MLDLIEPREVCRRLNRALCEITLLGKFVSFFYCILHSGTGRLSYCNAGHNPPLLIRSGGHVETLSSGDAVLAQFPNWPFSQRAAELHSGDALILFTDGIVEACGRSGDPFGEERADWIVGYLRNLCIYPNLYLMDALSSQIRHFSPVSVDQTEVTIYCIAPKGESAEMREGRLRQYEDFYNASGMATPDDCEEFRSCQRSFRARNAPWNDMSRGATHWITGPDEDAKMLGINPIRSGVRTEDEGLYPLQHGYWLETMKKAAVAEGQISSG